MIIFKDFLEIVIFLLFMLSSAKIIKINRIGINTKGILVDMPIPVKKKKKKRKTVSFQPEQQINNLSPGGSNTFDNNFSTNLNGGFNPSQNQNMLNLNIVPQSESDSDSAITTDFDLNEFERSMSM